MNSNDILHMLLGAYLGFSIYDTSIAIGYIRQRDNSAFAKPVVIIASTLYLICTFIGWPVMRYWDWKFTKDHPELFEDEPTEPEEFTPPASWYWK